MDNDSAQLKRTCKTVSSYLDLTSRPVGVKIFPEGDEVDAGGCSRPDKRATFCRFVKESSSGKDFLLKLEDIECPNAEVSLGFRDPMYVNIEPRLKKRTAALRVGPVEGADVVLLVLTPEQIMVMSILLGGITARFKGEMAICGESVADVYNRGETNVSFLCSGARLYGGFEPHELVLSLPYNIFLELPGKMGKFASLSKKARDGFAQILLRIR